MMVAIVTIMGIGSAFATKAPVHTNTEWGKIATEGEFYRVTALDNGFCNESVATICSVTSAAIPVDGLIPVEGATLTSRPGDFVPNP